MWKVAPGVLAESFAKTCQRRPQRAKAPVHPKYYYYKAVQAGRKNGMVFLLSKNAILNIKILRINDGVNIKSRYQYIFVWYMIRV